MNPALQGLLTIAIGVGGCVTYFYGANLFLDKVMYPARDVNAAKVMPRKGIAALSLAALPILAILGYWAVLAGIGLLSAGIGAILPGDATGGGLAATLRDQWPAARDIISSQLSMELVWTLTILVGGLAVAAVLVSPWRALSVSENINRANQMRPWVFLFPALFALGLYLAYPVFATLRLSFLERLPGNEYAFVGFDNYTRMFAEPKFLEAVRNNVLWLIVVPALSTAFGLMAAQLTDRLKWGSAAKSIIFMPMAISFVGAAVIFKLIYEARPVDVAQIGVLNAVYLGLGGETPRQWLQIPFWNNFFLMAVLIWIQTGFAMVILSAALRGIPEETVEAAIVDGANPFQIFFKIKVPQIMSTIVVVWTTITIATLKVFDIVFAMTNGQWETQVLANYMYDKLFRANDWGVGSASAMIIMLMVTPILVWNIYNARKENR